MVDGKKLKKILTKIFINHGLSQNHANISSNALINAELVGAHTHGLARLKMYCDRINKKVINVFSRVIAIILAGLSVQYIIDGVISLI